jgi:hypothetical protein
VTVRDEREGRPRTDDNSRSDERSEDQKLFPETGQERSFAVGSEDWQELNVPLAARGRVVHVRFFLPDGKRPVEIDWIEITPTGGSNKERQRWDFQDAAYTKNDKPKAR